MRENDDWKMTAVKLAVTKERIEREISDIEFDIADYYDTYYHLGINGNYYEQLMCRKRNLENELRRISEKLSQNQ